MQAITTILPLELKFIFIFQYCIWVS